jgi:hypothetical protein
MSASSDLPANAVNPPPSVRRCENCAAPLLGETCFACGQPTKGLIRRFGTILGDFADTVFNIDSRVFRTLGPLLARPGHLTREYLAGHRVRYVSPVRLFVFLSVLAFLATRWSINAAPETGDNKIRFGTGNDTSISAAQTRADVIAERDKALAGIAKAKAEGRKIPGMVAGMEVAEREIRKEADARLLELAADARADAAPGVGAPPGASDFNLDERTGVLTIDGKIWDEKKNPVKVAWLPAAGNTRLNAMIGRARENFLDFQKNPRHLSDAFFGVLPQTLFLLLPAFALLLKLVYLFKRRLYMEHLVVALHSHAFLCLSIGLIALLNIGQEMLAAGFLVGASRWMEALLWMWMPVYLLLTQKRVYQQGWPMTLLKFGLLGVGYCVLLAVAALAALAVSFVS